VSNLSFSADCKKRAAYLPALSRLSMIKLSHFEPDKVSVRNLLEKISNLPAGKGRIEKNAHLDMTVCNVFNSHLVLQQILEKL
jgi:hypothetical protein